MNIEPMPDELTAMIDAEAATTTAASTAAKARLLARLDASVERAMVTSALPWHRGWGASVGKAAACALAGAVGGAVFHAQYVQSIRPAQQLESSSVKIVLPVVAPPERAIVDAGVAAGAVVVERRPKIAEPSKPAMASTLEAERRLLEPARTALARGMNAKAEELLNAHASTFPQGSLAEEREALWVQVLAQSGQSERASEKASAFEQRFPDSLFLPVVQQALTKNRAQP